PPTSPLFPYTTLFRSIRGVCDVDEVAVNGDAHRAGAARRDRAAVDRLERAVAVDAQCRELVAAGVDRDHEAPVRSDLDRALRREDRKSTRLNSSHLGI